LLLVAGLALALPWFGRLVTAEAWFDFRACPWGFVMENVALGHVLFECFGFLPPPIRRTHLHLDATSIRMTSGRSVGIFKESGAISDVREHFVGSTVTLFLAELFCTS